MRGRLEDGTCELQSNPQGRSDIWKGFSKVVNTTSKEPYKFIACHTCHKTYRHGRSGGTSNLIEHLQKCMPGFEIAELPTKPELKLIPVTPRLSALVKTRKKKVEKSKQAVANDQASRSGESLGQFSAAFARYHLLSGFCYVMT